MIPVHHHITGDGTEDPAQVRHLIHQAEVETHQVHHQPAICTKTNHHLHMLKKFVQ